MLRYDLVKLVRWCGLGLGPLEVVTMKQSARSSVGMVEPQRERLGLVQAKHRELDNRLRELGRRAYLTPAEQLEMTNLKKRKLRAKDEIAILATLFSV
jgi:uncharacterized protein YdcH (DUF465 family)